MKKTENLSRADEIKVDLYSRSNSINGKYKACKIDLEVDADNSNDVFFLETILMKANLADRIIAEAEAQGEDLSDLKTAQALGAKINAMGKPLHKNESVMTAFFVSVQLMIYYGISLGVWGLVFNNKSPVFFLSGVFIGIVISLMFVAPVVASQRTKEQIKKIVDGVWLMWGVPLRFIFIVGIIALVVKSFFFT